MSLVAGIDYSTHAIDVVLLDEDSDRAEWHRFILPPTGDAFDRARTVRTLMPPRSWWGDAGVIAIGIEQPRGNFGVTPLFRIQGAILACLPTELLVQPWNPSSWRRAVGLKGNAPKDAVQLRAIDLWDREHGFPHWDGTPQDAFDAFCIAFATRSVLEHGPNPSLKLVPDLGTG